MRIKPAAVVAAVVAGIVVSSLWYSPFLFGPLWLELSGQGPGAGSAGAPPAWKMLVELVRELVVAYVLARIVVRTGVADWKAALGLGFWVWLGFPLAMLVGASLWDDKPWLLTCIHAGDWLLKMPIMALVVASWRR